MIRKVEAKDIDFIVKLEMDTLSTTLGHDMIYNEIFNNPFANYFIYEDTNKTLLGYISTNFDGEIIEILNICVSKDYQHHSIGTKLITYVIDSFLSKNAKSVFLEVRESNTQAINFYNKFGLKLINRRKNYYKTEDALVLELKLTSYSELNHDLLSNFCEFEETNNYIEYHDDVQKDKYAHNCYYIKNELCVNEIITKNEDKPFINIISKNKLNLNDFILGYCGIMHIFNNNYNSLKPLIGDFYVLDGDNEELRELLYNDQKAYGVNYAKNNVNRYFNMALTNKKFKYLYIKKDNKIIGCLLLYIYKQTGFIEDFFVLEEYRHNGYGNSIIINTLKYLLSINCYDCYLEVDMDDTPKDMYKKIGFSLVDYDYEYFRG